MGLPARKPSGGGEEYRLRKSLGKRAEVAGASRTHLAEVCLEAGSWAVCAELRWSEGRRVAEGDELSRAPEDESRVIIRLRENEPD